MKEIICPYCHIPIKDHPVTACLDAVVAKNVMGWHLEQGPPYRGSDPCWCSPIEGRPCGLGQRLEKYWEPSTNISDAMEGESLLEKETREHKARYCGILKEVIAHDLGYPKDSYPLDLEFEMVHATARQRTRALIFWAMEKEG